MTPTNDNATAGRVNTDALNWIVGRLREAGLPEAADTITALQAELSAMKADRLYIMGALHGYEAAVENDEAHPAAKALQARVAEVEAERDAMAFHLNMHVIDVDALVKQNADLGMENKRLREALRQISEATTEHGGAAKALRIINAALAQSGGADLAQGKGDGG